MAHHLFLGIARGTSGTAAWEYGLHFETETLDPAFAMNAWSSFNATLWVDGLTTHFGYRTFTGPGVVQTELAVYELDPSTDRKTSVVRSNGFGAGTAGGTLMPSPCATLAIFKPSPAVPGVEGRLYLPPLTTGQMSGQGVASAIAANVSLQLREALAEMIPTGVSPVIRNRKAHSSYPAVLLGVSTRVAYLKSREQKLKPTYK